MSDLAKANVEVLAIGEVIFGYPCMSVPNILIYIYPEYFELRELLLIDNCY